MKDPDDPPTVLIVDDNPIVLYGLRFALEQQTRFVVCGEAGHAESARGMARYLRPDYVILDLVLGGGLLHSTNGSSNAPFADDLRVDHHRIQLGSAVIATRSLEE